MTHNNSQLLNKSLRAQLFKITKSLTTKEIEPKSTFNNIYTLNSKNGSNLQMHDGANVRISLNEKIGEKNGKPFYRVTNHDFRFTAAIKEGDERIVTVVPADVYYSMKAKCTPLFAVFGLDCYRIPLNTTPVSLEFRRDCGKPNIFACFVLKDSMKLTDEANCYVKPAKKIYLHFETHLNKILMFRHKNREDWCAGSIKKIAQKLKTTYQEIYKVYRTSLKNNSCECYNGYFLTANPQYKDYHIGEEWDPTYNGKYDGKDYKQFAKVLIWLKRDLAKPEDKRKGLNFPSSWSNEERAFAENWLLENWS